ncbi:O-antigen ligase family protein [Candidatus Curtissbacteria bacterium]|nr:O-antigen ligase family protein [Candidatus Curtissbacteria bacterium]
MSRVFFLLVIAVLPVQLSKFFFLDHSFVLGIPIDYRAAALYLSDIAIVMFTIAAILENRKRIVVIAARYKDYIAALAVFNLYLFFSAVFFSVSPPASYFFSLKFFIFSLFSIAAAVALQNRRVGQNGLLVLGISVFWQALLLIAQFARQGAIGLQILGERSFDAGTVQIAHSQLAGRQFLRPYGTFPHPNVAAAYLAFSLIILFGAAGAQKRKLAPARIILAITTILAVFLTFSKSAIAVLLLGVLATVKSLPRLLLLLLPVAIIGFFAASQLWANLAPVAERLLLSQAALDIALINPAFGVGAANFILELARLDLVSLSETRLLQPVHNVFLLILAENGIFGLMIFAALLLVVARYLQGRTKTVIFIGLLLYLSLDHFLWTLQQGQMMFFLTLAYIVSQSKK